MAYPCHLKQLGFSLGIVCFRGLALRLLAVAVSPHYGSLEAGYYAFPEQLLLHAVEVDILEFGYALLALVDDGAHAVVDYLFVIRNVQSDRMQACARHCAAAAGSYLLVLILGKHYACLHERPEDRVAAKHLTFYIRAGTRDLAGREAFHVAI